MARKSVADGTRLDVPYLLNTGLVRSEGETSQDLGSETNPNLLVLCACCQVLPIRAEAHASDVQVTVFVDSVVLQFRDLPTS